MPALKIDGEKVTGSREIARELDGLEPEPPLYPADPDAAARSRRPSAGATRCCRPRPAG